MGIRVLWHPRPLGIRAPSGVGVQALGLQYIDGWVEREC
jgi:hypothetical protein